MSSHSLASYTSSPENSRGRFFTEPESATRGCFQRDRDRIIHATAFRRLIHKTQVFVYHEGDHYRTRLTHSLEVSQIARSIARVLGVNEDLSEALALAHDLGHPPFGHAGEDELAKCMAPYDGFDHNAQALRVVTRLEHRYAAFDGLNLTWETLEGLVKHNGPLLGDGPRDALPAALRAFEHLDQLELTSHPAAEAQVAALADDIAYNNHDIDDGLRAGLFSVEDIVEVPLVGEVFRNVMEAYPGIELSRLIHESIRRLISSMVDDALMESRTRIARYNLCSPDDVRNCGEPLIAFSEGMKKNDRALKKFLKERMYHHYKINRMMSQARRIIADLFDLFLNEPGTLPTEWRAQCDDPLTPQTARVVCDFIAGMTDRFALEEHKRLFSLEKSI